MNEKSVINKADYYSQKSLVLRQIERCATLFSGFAPGMEVSDERMQTYTFIQGSQQGKAVASAVITLFDLCKSFLSKEDYDRLNTLGIKVFTKINIKSPTGEKIQNIPQYKTSKTWLFMAPSPELQFRGIMELHDFYQELCTTIFSHASFRDPELISADGGEGLAYDRGEPIDSANIADEEKD